MECSIAPGKLKGTRFFLMSLYLMFCIRIDLQNQGNCFSVPYKQNNFFPQTLTVSRFNLPHLFRNTLRIPEQPVDARKQDSFLPLTGSRTNISKVIVTGLRFTENHRDVFPLEALHQLNVFDSLVVYAEDPSLALKRITSRSTRYSGLLGKVEILPCDTRQFPYINMPLVLHDTKTSYLAFCTSIKEITTFLTTFPSSSKLHRCVVALPLDSMKENLSSVFSTLRKEIDRLRQRGAHLTVIISPSTILSPIVGEPVFMYDVSENSTKNDFVTILKESPYFDQTPLSSSDFYRCVCECLCLPEADNKLILLSKGTPALSNKLKQLQAGHAVPSRKIELSILLNISSSLLNHNSSVLQNQDFCLAKVEKPENTPPIDAAAMKRLEIDNLFEKALEVRKARQKKKEEEQAYQILSREWRVKYYSMMENSHSEECDEETYIRMHWLRGVAEAKKALAKL